MNAKDLLKLALSSTQKNLAWYLSDLSDADLLVRPVPGANHIAWQLGHLISAEPHLLAESLPGVSYPPLPANWDKQHGKENARVDPPTGFLTKEAYLSLFNKNRDATIAALGKLTEADLDKPTVGSMAKHAPTLGSLLVLTSDHTTMHAGQFTVVRRKLGKPVLF